MPDGCVIGYSASADQHPMEDLARHLDGLGVQNLGIEMDSRHFSAKAFSVLLQLLPGIGFADARNMVNLQRLIKSEPEIAFMRKAAAISVKVIGGLGARVELGASMNDVLAEVYRDAIRGVDGASGDYPAVAPSLGYGANRSTWDDRPFAAGDVASAQISGCFRRYHAPLCRSMILGPKSDDLRRTEAALIRALDAGIDVARSGNKARDIAKAMAGTGLEIEGAFGYPIGIGYPPDWDEGAISIGFDDHSVLEPNMTFHISPRVILDGQRIATSESIRIRSDGAAEIFCDCPREIICKL
jgi:ectoine hydrolase